MRGAGTAHLGAPGAFCALQVFSRFGFLCLSKRRCVFEERAAWRGAGLLVAAKMPAAIPSGLIKTCIHTYVALAAGVLAYNVEKSCTPPPPSPHPISFQASAAPAGLCRRRRRGPHFREGAGGGGPRGFPEPARTRASSAPHEGKGWGGGQPPKGCQEFAHVVLDSPGLTVCRCAFLQHGARSGPWRMRTSACRA